MWFDVERAGAKTPPYVRLDRSSRSIRSVHGQSAEVFDAQFYDVHDQGPRKGTYARFLPAEQITLGRSSLGSTYTSGTMMGRRSEKVPVQPTVPPMHASASAYPTYQSHELPLVTRYGSDGEFFFMPPQLTERDKAQMKGLGLYLKRHSHTPLHTVNPIVTYATYLVNRTHRLVHIIDDSGSMNAMEKDGKAETRWEDAHHFVGLQTGITAHAGGDVVMALLNDANIYTVNENGITARDPDNCARHVPLPKTSWFDFSNKQQRIYHNIHAGVEQVFQVHSATGLTPLLGSIQRVLRQISQQSNGERYLGEDNQYHDKPYLVILSTDGHPTDTKNIPNQYDTQEVQSQVQRQQIDEIATLIKRAVRGEFTNSVAVRFSFRLCTDEQDVVFLYRNLLENHREIGPFVDVTAHLRDEQQAYRAKYPRANFMDMPHRRDLKVQSMIGPTTNLSRIKNKNIPSFYTGQRAIANPGKDFFSSPVSQDEAGPSSNITWGIPVG